MHIVPAIFQSPTALLVLMLFCQVGFMGATLWLKYLKNKNLFASPANLQPVRSKNVFFGAFSGFYDRLDRIPFLRRSGQANSLDLLKAMLLTVVPVFLLELAMNRPSLLVALAASNILLFLVNAIFFAHGLSRRS